MNRLFLCPSGVSLLLSAKKHGCPESPESVKSFLYSASKADQRVYSAELNSLFAMQLCADDKVVFLSSDTNDGLRIANLLKGFLEEQICCEVDVKCIPGLQTNNRKRFDREGISNLTDEVVKRIEDNQYNYQIIINATSGFKATVPYLTLIGMVFEIPIRYLFELSSELIELPPLPISFDLVKLERLSPIIDDILDDLLPVTKICESLGIRNHQLKDEFSDLLLIEDGLVMLRPTGRILYQRYLYTYSYKQVFINKRVQDKLESGRYARSTFFEYFKRMRNPIFLKAKTHHEVKKTGRIDVDCFKQQRTSDRIFYYCKENKLYIVDIFAQHNEYDRFVDNGKLLRSEVDKEMFFDFENL